MDKNRPQGRKKHVTDNGKGFAMRGEGRGTGPKGSGGGLSAGSGSQSGGSSGGSQSGGRTRAGGGKLPLIAILLIVLLGGGGGLGGLLGGQSGGSGSSGSNPAYYDLLTGSGGSTSGTTAGWSTENNTGVLNREVSDQARERFTTIKGGGRDTMTIMVYMCGTDLESRSGMATSDLQEMASAKLSDKINIIVYTGGCKGWRNNIVSSKTNQIYQVRNGGLVCLNKNAGAEPMTKPETLAGFIKWCAKNYPADRNELIFWDHGGGSISGYGYDEKFPRSGSMSLSGIDTALKAGGIKFDFIGFDACLMATVENGQMLSKYADYMIASEETEPGVGWYYTDWLNKLSQNTSMETIEIGKNIADDFVKVCNQRCPGQQTTLSVVDLAELGQTFGTDFAAFARDTRDLIKNNEYKKVSAARSGTREFAKSSRIDQIDLVHFARNLGSKEGKSLAKVLLSAVKYNRTSSNMTNAYGLSVYFPYQKASSVDTAAKTYEAIGLDDEYTKCIKEFAGLEVSGQVATGGTTTPVPSLFDMLGSGSSVQSSDQITQLLGAFLSSGSGIQGLGRNNTQFMEDREMSDEDTAAYIADNQLDQANLIWAKNSSGQQVISMPEDQWGLVEDLALSMYYDDGNGYAELGLDNVYEFDDDGNLIGTTDGTWVSINGQPVAYYYTDTTEDEGKTTITGYVPAVLNGDDVKLIIIFDDDSPDGRIAGARPDYPEKETETLSRGLIELKKGDTLEFTCDYYKYDGTFDDNYFIGDPMKVTDKMEISNTKVGDGKFKAMYRFTDIYNQNYWTPAIEE